MSLLRFGYRSIVFEGSPSSISFAQYGLEVRALSSRRADAGQWSGGISRLRNGEWGLLGHLLLLGGFGARFAWRYLALPFRQVPRADLYYVHSYEYLPLCLAIRRGAACIYDAHDFYQGILPAEKQPEFDRRFLMPVLGRLERAMARRCRAVVSVSAGVACALQAHIHRKPYVIMNFVDRRTNRSAHGDIRTTVGLGNSQRLLVMVGNNKAGIPFDFVIAMLKDLPGDIHIAFLGRGYGSAQEHAQTSGVVGRLHFVPARPPFEVSSYIATADAGLLLYRAISPNYRSALPNGFFHLIDAGLPVARLALPEVEALIGGADVGPVLDATDPAQAANSLARFLGDSAQLSAARVRATALGDQLTWQSQEHLLHGIVGVSRSPKA